MRSHGRRWAPVLTTLGAILLMVLPVRAADPEIDRLLQSPVGKDWVTNGGNLKNQRYSTLKHIDTTNVSQLKGAWMTRMKGSGLGGKYSFEALVRHRPEDLHRLLRLGEPRPRDG